MFSLVEKRVDVGIGDFMEFPVIMEDPNGDIETLEEAQKKLEEQMDAICLIYCESNFEPIEFDPTMQKMEF
jgi:hypothetical protein